MTKDIIRYFLEIKSIKDLNSVELISPNYSINLLEPRDLQLNKFFYKIVGKKYSWTDRLAWSEVKWIDYISNEKLSTYVLRNENDIAGYFELIFHEDKKETEIAYFGILEEYFGKKLGGYLLSEAIKCSFNMGSGRVWVHTCTLDHKNALKNYLARGMKNFKSETLIR